MDKFSQVTIAVPRKCPHEEMQLLLKFIHATLAKTSLSWVPGSVVRFSGDFLHVSRSVSISVDNASYVSDVKQRTHQICSLLCARIVSSCSPERFNALRVVASIIV